MRLDTEYLCTEFSVPSVRAARYRAALFLTLFQHLFGDAFSSLQKLAGGVSDVLGVETEFVHHHVTVGGFAETVQTDRRAV